MRLFYAAIVLSLFSHQAFATTGNATVILLKGKALVTTGGQAKELSLKDVVPQGASVKTEARSFVKLAFQDNSQINVGPDSQLKIEATPANQPGVVNLLSGQIRAQVTKDLLKVDTNEKKDKLFVKTKTAAMGIRGTDFQTIYNPANQNTSLVTFEGNVAMVKVVDGQDFRGALYSDRVVSVGPGQYSGAGNSMPNASIPVKISPAQMATLQSNDAMQGVGEKTQQKSDIVGSNVPPGVDPKNFASNDSGMANALSTTVGAEAMAAATKASDTGKGNNPPPEGFYNANTGAYAPRAGGFIDLNSGTYIPPPPGSSFDPNTGVFVPPKALGSFDPATGNYMPPKGMELDPQKGFIPAKGEAAATAKPGAAIAATNAAAAVAKILNQSMAPQNAGVTATFAAAFVPGGGNANMPPLPPPGSLPPQGFIPQPDRPINDPTCPTCRYENIQTTAPVLSPVQFQITVGP